MRRIIGITAALAAIVVASPGAATAQVTVDDFIMALQPADGATALSIPIRNETTRAFDIYIELNDWSRDASGEHVFHALGSGPESCGGNITAPTEPIRLVPGESSTITIDYVGRSSDRCRTMVWLRTTELVPDEEQESMNFIVRTGVKIMVGARR